MRPPPPGRSSSRTSRGPTAASLPTPAAWARATRRRGRTPRGSSRTTRCASSTRARSSGPTWSGCRSAGEPRRSWRWPIPGGCARSRSWRALYPVAAQSAPLRAAWEKQAYAWLFSEAYWRNEAAVRAALRFAGSQPFQSVQGFAGQIDAALAHDSVSRLPGLRVPTLVAPGSLDQLAPAAGAEEMARLIPGAQLLLLAEVGHAVNLEGQRAVNRSEERRVGKECRS